MIGMLDSASQRQLLCEGFPVLYLSGITTFYHSIGDLLSVPNTSVHTTVLNMNFAVPALPLILTVLQFNSHSH